MTSPVLALYLISISQFSMAQATNLNSSSSVEQDSQFVSVKTGENLTLQCLFEEIVAARLYWFKQKLGEKPKLISTFYIYDQKKYIYGEFKNNSRFTLDTENGNNHLTITDLHISDSATYFCVSCYLYTLEISVSITVNIKDSGLNVPVLVHQSASKTIQPGGSVTLNCTVHTGTCDGQHSVYWFKGSEESHPALIYTHGGSSDQCERKLSTQTHTCVYNLPMKNLSLFHAGTYYCAVASCGHILFGDGIKLDVEDEEDSLFLVYLLSGALTFTAILSVLLALSVCMMNKGNSGQSTEFQARCPAPSTANAMGHQHADILYYTALSVNLHNGSRRQKDPSWSECVYYSMKQ